MRWLALYARSRTVPVSVLAALVAATAVGACAHAAAGEGPLDPRFAVLMPGIVVAAGARGLTGQDPELERTAALRWAPRRAVHVLLIALLGAAVLAAARATAEGPVAAGAAFRDAAGLSGLAAAGAALGIGLSAWALPLGWTAIALFVPPGGGTLDQVLAWMLQPPSTTAATWTSLLLAGAGTAAYALGVRRR